MATKKQLNRAIARAERVQEQVLKLQAEAEEAAREADRVLGSAVRQAVTESRSKWAKLAHVSVSEFYRHVVDDVDIDDVANVDDAATDAVPADGHHLPHDFVDSDGGGGTDYVGGSQGF